MISASFSVSPNTATMALSSKSSSSSSHKNKSSNTITNTNNNNYTSPMTLHRTTTPFLQRRRDKNASSSLTVVRAENNKEGEEPKLTRKNEAETEAFLSPAEKSGENPLKDPMAIIGIVGILGVPALILLVGVTSGYIGQ